MNNSLRKFIIKNEKIIGTIATILGVLMFFSMIEILSSNTRGDSHIIVQPAATAVNGLFWTLYAYGKKTGFYLYQTSLL